MTRMVTILMCNKALNGALATILERSFSPILTIATGFGYRVLQANNLIVPVSNESYMAVK